MYEIYINDRPLRLLSAPQNMNEATHLTARYTGKVKTLLHYADLLEKGSPKVTAVDIYYKDVEKLWQDFKSHYKIIEAAGGLVNLKDTNKYLFIYRRGYLDIPKGKIDKGETAAEAAIREVMEETGLSAVHMLQPQDYQLTYHTYRTTKGKRILKPTYWFDMETEQEQLIPEVEEDILWAKWMTRPEALEGDLPFYPSLKCLLKEHND